MGSDQSGTKAKAYEAAINKQWEVFKKYCEDDNSIMTFPMTGAKNTVLHIAVYSGSAPLVRDLLVLAPPGLCELVNERGDTVLHEVAAVGNVEMAKDLIGYDKQLLKTPNKRGETPLFSAAAFNQTKMVKFLASKAEDKSIHRRRSDGTSILHVTILSKYFDTALELVRWDFTLRKWKDENGMTCFQLLANMPDAFKSGQSMNILEKLIYLCIPDHYDDNDVSVENERQVTSRRGEDLEDNDDPSDESVEYERQGTSRRGEDLEDNDDPDDESVDLERQVTSRREKDQEGGRGSSRARQYFDFSNGRRAISRIYNTIFAAISRIYNTLIWWRIAQGLLPIKRLGKMKKQQKIVLQLAASLRIVDDTWMGTKLGETPERISVFFENKDFSDGQGAPPVKVDKRSHAALSSEPPIISAARNGIIEIVDLILDMYPQAPEAINDQGENIFHIAAKYRRKEMLDRLRDLPAASLSRISRKLNDHGDSILHQAAYQEDTYHLRDQRPGEALHMQSEIQWFKRVRKLVPQYFSHHRNNENKTAEELFTDEHKGLVGKGQAWLMRTAKACTIVAVLIATVAFTCAYTIPGGPNSKTGHPLLLKATAFRTFTVSDTLSLCFSLTSVVVFLSIMTSRMQEQDFRRSLPLKLVLGLTTLFFAVAAMMVAFASTLMLALRQRLPWVAIPIYTLACWPVAIFLALQFPLYLNIAWFTVSDILQSSMDSLSLRKCMIHCSEH